MEGREIVHKFSHSLNAYSPIFTTPFGTQIFVSEEFPQNAFSLISLTFSGISISVRPAPKKALTPIVSTFPGIITVLSLVQYAKIRYGISVRFSDNVTEVRFLHSSNTDSPMIKTEFGIVIVSNDEHLQNAPPLISVMESGKLIFFRL